MIDSLVRRYEDNKLLAWFLIILIPTFTLLFGSLLFEEIFWESFLWRYFWGPVVADAEAQPVNGITAGYNIINTVTYGVVLVVSFFGIYELITHFNIQIDEKFVFSLLPWIFLGGSLRSLEDVGIFEDPLDKLMISPMIYFLLGISAILLMVIGAYISHKNLDSFTTNSLKAVLLLPLPLIYLILSSYLTVFSVWFLVVILVVAIISFIIGYKYFELNERYLFLSYGLILLSTSVAYNAHHLISVENTRAIELLVIISMSFLVTGLVVGISWLSKFLIGNNDNHDIFKIVKSPLNLIIIWAHLFDASSTFRGVTAFGYEEKHVLPAFMMELGGVWMIFVGKLFLIIFAIYILDIEFKKELSERKELTVLLKFVIIVLGLAPGFRNTLRIAMAV